MKKFVLKNSETGFQKAETRFQNAKTALSRIFFARTWMDSAQKSLHSEVERGPVLRIQRTLVLFFLVKHQKHQLFLCCKNISNTQQSGFEK